MSWLSQFNTKRSLLTLPFLIDDMETKYSYQDVAIMPCVCSEIEHRSECKLPSPLPIFAAPMTSVVGKDSWENYVQNDIIPILPRSESMEDRLKNDKGWSAFGLEEFKAHYVESGSLPSCKKVLVDIANGHMSYLYKLVREAKDIWKSDLTVMVGNIANPQTYLLADAAGADYVRVGIGAGAGCITASNCAIFYPMASLIQETAQVKKECNGTCKIVADGGIRGYDDVIKALGLGADYVMIGSLLSGLVGSSGEVTEDGYKIFYGMASAKGQLDMHGKKIHTAEGIVKRIPITGTLGGWVQNMKDYLRSAMSYCGTHELKEFKPEFVILSERTYNR